MTGPTRSRSGGCNVNVATSQRACAGASSRCWRSIPQSVAWRKATGSAGSRTHRALWLGSPGRVVICPPSDEEVAAAPSVRNNVRALACGGGHAGASSQLLLSVSKRTAGPATGRSRRAGTARQTQRFVEHPWQVPLQSRVIGLLVFAGDLELLEGEVFVVGAAHPEGLMVRGGAEAMVCQSSSCISAGCPTSADVQRRDLQARRRIAVRVDLASESAPLLADASSRKRCRALSPSHGGMRGPPGVDGGSWNSSPSYRPSHVQVSNSQPKNGTRGTSSGE